MSASTVLGTGQVGGSVLLSRLLWGPHPRPSVLPPRRHTAPGLSSGTRWPCSPPSRRPLTSCRRIPGPGLQHRSCFVTARAPDGGVGPGSGHWSLRWLPPGGARPLRLDCCSFLASLPSGSISTPALSVFNTVVATLAPLPPFRVNFRIGLGKPPTDLPVILSGASVGL